MFTLLEFIFQGFLEWVYSLILEIWNFFVSSLLNVMTLDFAYIKSHIPVVTDISQKLLAVGWALLLGNLVFQALRSMTAGLGFEGEDPKLLFARTFVFGFLLLASPQICETILTLTSRVITLLEIPDTIDVHLVDSSAFGVLGASWILVIIFDIITMFMVLSLLLEVAEQYMVLAMLTVMAPLAFAMGGSKSTSEIFTGWCRMFGSMCFLVATKGAANGLGGTLGIAGKGASGAGKSAVGFGKRTVGAAFRSTGRAAANAAGGIGSTAADTAVQRNDRPRYGGGHQQKQQSNSQQEHTASQSQQIQQSQQNTSRTQTSSQQQTVAQERATNSCTTEPRGNIQVDRSSRKTSVPQGMHQTSSHVAFSDTQSKAGEITASPGSSFDSIGTPKDTTHSSGTFGGHFSGIARGSGFNRTSSSSTTQSTSQENISETTTTSQVGTAGTGQSTASTKRPAAQQGKRITLAAPKASPATAQPDAAGMQAYDLRRPSGFEPRHSRNRLSSTSPTLSGVQGSSMAQRKKQRPGSPLNPQVMFGSSQPGTAGT